MTDECRPNQRKVDLFLTDYYSVLQSLSLEHFIEWIDRYSLFPPIWRVPELGRYNVGMIWMQPICNSDGISKIDFYSIFQTKQKLKKSADDRKAGKGIRALRGYFGPPLRSKIKSCSSQVSSY